MRTIRNKLSILFISCSLLAIFLVILFVNLTINNIFHDYMETVQNKRYERIVSYLEEHYKKDARWSDTSGIELMHEAYMSNYYLTLYNKNNKVIWGMDPMDIRSKINMKNMKVEEQGVYLTRKFELHYENEIVGFVEVGQYAPLLMTDEDELFKINVNKSIIMSGLIAIIITIFVGLYYSKQFSEPIKEISGMSVKLSQGKFGEKSKAVTDMKEIAELKNSINILAEKLNSQDALRKRLVSDISHEIRTPLNVLQNNLEAMIDGVFPVSGERLTHLNNEVIRFGKLLNNLDNIKDFENESMKLNFHALDLKYLFENIYKDYLKEAKDKHIDMKFICDNERYIILGDEDRLRQVFINLVDNAVKFTEKNGHISIGMKKDKHKIFVEITDDGMGIKKEDLPYVFERLYRGDKSRHEIQGSGIGLTIVKNILRLHSALINIDSAEGKGTKVTIEMTEMLS